ncbi:hypothetical protein O181_114472 [Austropuccinia psidii MF-1]|uniref:Uncharacterized protein n=1 Tax=Austropuccinia psidii MF-1 TaxID=1389203 RepID=A0A9Q3K7M4_9BASI|nr:hypothetical protein [Austropuccinia psidii MF-1]
MEKWIKLDIPNTNHSDQNLTHVTRAKLENELISHQIGRRGGPCLRKLVLWTNLLGSFNSNSSNHQIINSSESFQIKLNHQSTKQKINSNTQIISSTQQAEHDWFERLMDKINDSDTESENSEQPNQDLIENSKTQPHQEFSLFLVQLENLKDHQINTRSNTISSFPKRRRSISNLSEDLNHRHKPSRRQAYHQLHSSPFSLRRAKRRQRRRRLYPVSLCFRYSMHSSSSSSFAPSLFPFTIPSANPSFHPTELANTLSTLLSIKASYRFEPTNLTLNDPINISNKLANVTLTKNIDFGHYEFLISTDKQTGLIYLIGSVESSTIWSKLTPGLKQKSNGKLIIKKIKILSKNKLDQSSEVETFKESPAKDKLNNNQSWKIFGLGGFNI